MNIGLLIIATNKYTQFLQNLITSADKHFLTDKNVTYFIFTNKIDFKIESNRHIVMVPVEHKPWPFMTLHRYKIFTENSEYLKEMDFLYYCDVDMLFVDDVGDEILGDRVGTIHPGFYLNPHSSNISLEKRPESLAYLPPNTIKNYYAGGFNGGRNNEFLKMAHVISENIDFDLKNYNIIAEWHDESHMNKYFYDNPLTIELPPSYCYPEYGINGLNDKKLLALVKNHNEYRS